jgi:hypothetical protein
MMSRILFPEPVGQGLLQFAELGLALVLSALIGLELVRSGDERAPGARLYPFDAGHLVMIRTSSLAVTLALSLIVPAFGQETEPSQARSQNAQSKDVCRAKCEAQ